MFPYRTEYGELHDTRVRTLQNSKNVNSEKHKSERYASEIVLKLVVAIRQNFTVLVVLIAPDP